MIKYNIICNIGSRLQLPKVLKAFSSLEEDLMLQFSGNIIMSHWSSFGENLYFKTQIYSWTKEKI